jgi:hypothetical protein
MGLPTDLAFRTKGQLAIDILAEAFADGVRLDFVCGDEVYGACTELREYLEDHDQAYVLRVPSSFRLILADGITLTCKQAAVRLGSRHRWEICELSEQFDATSGYEKSVSNLSWSYASFLSAVRAKNAI